MATEGDRQSVFRTTKVRTALKGDNSWINRRQDPATGEEEKPWISAVPSSNNTSNPPTTNRFVSTKTDKPSSTASNGYIGTSGSSRKPTDKYKEIAAHATRVNTESPEPPETTVSAEERERRMEEASKVLNSSAGKQRSYVHSAAKKYDTPPDASAPPATSFVAKRVVITDDEESHLEQPKQSYSVEMSVDEPPKPKPKPEPTTKSSNEPVVAATAPAPVATLKKTTDSTPKASITEPVAPATPNTKDVPPSAPEATPKPSVKPKPVENTSALNDDDLLGLTTSPPQKPTDPVPTADLLTGSSLPKSKETKGSLDLLAIDVIPIDTNTDKLSPSKTSTRVETKTDVKTDVKSDKPVQKNSGLNDQDLLGLTQSPPQKPTDPVPTADLLTGSSLPKSKETKGSLDLLAIDVIPIDTNTDILSPSKTSTRVETKTDVKTDVKSDKPVQKNSGLNDQDLLGLTQSPPQKPTDPVPTADLLTGSSLPKSKDTKASLDLLAIDVIPIDTNTDKLSPSKTSTRVETKTDVKTDVKSPVEMFDPLLSDSTSHRTVSVTFEQKSTDSKPWSKWAIPTVGTEEDEEREEGTENVSNTPEPEPEPESDSRKNLVYVKSYMNSSSDLPRHSGSWYDGASDQLDYVTSRSTSYAYSAPPSVGMTACTYCGKMVGNDSKITIDHLNISSHPECFKCGICSKPMGDFIDSMFLHRGTIHCESCYANVI